jgi:hypothetical protein
MKLINQVKLAKNRERKYKNKCSALAHMDLIFYLVCKIMMIRACVCFNCDWIIYLIASSVYFQSFSFLLACL